MKKWNRQARENRRFSRLSGAFLLSGLIFLLSGMPLAAQQTTTDLETFMANNSPSFFKVELYGEAIDELQRPIQIHARSEPRLDVLREIARQGRLGIALNANEPALHTHITLVLEESTIAEGLTFALAGTGFEAAITRRREIVLLEKALAKEPVSRRQQQDQFGTVIGEVRDAMTGESLPGANVIVKGTTIGVATDIDGRFTLRRVPVGNQVLEIRYLGFETQEIPVRISEDERLTVNVVLEGDLIEGDEVFVIGRQRGQARALTRQRESVNIRSVVSSEQMDRFADETVEGSLQRIAGMGHGGANIRGVGPAASNITMDGQRMGSTGTGDRAVDIGTISSDMVQELEVIKVITPDMDADALSGVINVSTRRPIGGERTLNARLGGGLTTRFVGAMGPSSRASLSYGESPTDNFSYAVNLSYQRGTNAGETVRTDWGMRNFGEGPVDVLSGFRHSMNFDPRDRYSAALQFTFQPTDRSTFHVQGMFNLQERRDQFHEYRYGIIADRYTTRNQTGPLDVGNQASIGYNTQLSEQDIHQYTFQAGARHLFDGFDLEYALGWGHGRYYRDRYGINFSTDSRYEFIIDYPDRWHPEVSIAPWGERSTFPRMRDLNMGGVDHRWDSHIDNEFRGSVDVAVPFRRGTFKFGSSGLMTLKDGLAERYNQNFQSRVTLYEMRKQIKMDWRTLNRQHESYYMPWVLDLNAAKDWYEGVLPDFQFNINQWAESAEGNSYVAQEFTWGTYGMATVQLNRFTFLGGLRMEYAGNNYKGRDGAIDDEGRWLGAVDVSSSNTYVHFFPNAQMVYAVGSRSNARLAYSRSVGRPSFSQLSPSTIRNYRSESISRGNPDLMPMLSNNIDLLFEHYFMNVGQFTLGLYYKALSDFVYSVRERVPDEGIDGEGRHAGWWTNEFRNGEEATVYGFEASWQQHLDFLPGFLSNFATYVNYSFAYSEADLDRDEPARLAGQRPHVVNAGLDYSQGPFSAQASYRWGSPSISGYGDPRFVPEIQLRERVWFDSYRDAANDLSLTLRYRITSNFRLWMDASNILNYRSVSFQHDRDYYPREATLNGRSLSMGLRYSL